MCASNQVAQWFWLGLLFSPVLEREKALNMASICPLLLIALNIPSICPAFELYVIISSLGLAKWARAKLTNTEKLCVHISSCLYCTVLLPGYMFSWLLCTFYITLDRYQKQTMFLEQASTNKNHWLKNRFNRFVMKLLAWKIICSISN